MASIKADSSHLRTNGKTNRSKVIAPRNPKLIRTQVEEEKQTPSAFMAEMALTTDERLKQTREMRIPQIIELLDMSETTHQKFTMLDIEMPLFQPFPSEIVFQNYEPFETYTVPLNLRNNDKVARLVKVTQTDSPYFEIVSPPDVGHKVAPGMDTVFLIKFTPDEKKDYSHELICITEREKFLIPVTAVGARAILDFPDDINFQSCPVKYSSTKTLLVRNVGNKTAKFKLLTNSPFSASPENGVLGVAESIQIDLKFQPIKTGDLESNLVISYDTGEDVYVALYGVSTDVNVRLDKNALKLENTYITSASQRTVSIMNRSDVVVHFQWKPLATLAEELQQKQRFYQELTFREEEQRDSFLEECISDPTLRDKLSLVTRSFKNRIKVAEGEKMLYSDEVISIDPVEGDIWPNSHADVSIVFKPDEAKSYARTVYCDVTGRESRLPLRIRGDGVGAKIKFSFDTLDIENIFVNSEHSYEVIMKNVGDIDVVFSHVLSDSLFGQQFEFSPSEGIIVPGGYQAIKINFTSPYLGEFHEDFVWTVEGSPEKFKFRVSGCVIGPTFHFDTPNLKFDTVAYGFTHVAACRLINTSLIPMTFYLRVPSDGTGHPASSIAGSFISDSFIDESHLHQPREFEIYPSSGTLAAHSEVEIQVNLTSLTEQKYETCLVVDVEGVGREILSLPITARSIVPGIGVETPIIDYGRCFIRYPYEKMVVLKNETDLPAKYEFLPQITEDRPTIRYSTHYVKGIIQPQSIIEIPLQIAAHGMEKLVATAFCMIYGCSDMPLQIQLCCIGEGPVVHVSTPEIDYGNIPVLENISRQIKLSNESLIPAEFYCDLVRPNSLFSVEPRRGVLAAERSATLTVIAKLDDCLRFQDKLKISVTDGQLLTVFLSGQGIGTTITTEPPMPPAIEVGATFTSLVCTRKYRIFNRGRRPQQIFWSTEGFPLSRSKRKQEYNKDDVKYQRMPPPPAPPRPVFKLKPDRMSLAPGQSQEVFLEGFSDKCQQVRERMICHAIVGNNTGKEKIMKVDVIADFIEPLVRFSDRKISFFVMKHPHTELVKEVKELLLGNVSKLPLRISLETEYPFQIIANDQFNESSYLDLHLLVNQSVPLSIQFDPDYKQDKYCRTAQTNLTVRYQDHPNTDSVELTGDVFYPNLHFESSEVDFGCVLNDTEHVKNLTVTNTSPLKVLFKWSFQENVINFEGKEDDEGLGRDISDGEDDAESKENSLSPSQNKLEESADRPRTSPVISNLPIQIRPATAPESSSLPSSVQALPWMPIGLLKESISIQEVFDVLPLYGELEPGETQKFQFTFYGHSHAMAEAAAVCSVHGGPDYRILLKGQASLLQYGFNTTKIDLGRQIYDHVITSEIVLFNRGKVNFDFTVLDTDRGTNPLPSGITVLPAQGIVEAQQSLALVIRFIPGFPDSFHKQFRIRVGHFEPEMITLIGKGIFPRITFELPRDGEDPRYCKYLEQAKSMRQAIDKNSSGAYFLENVILASDKELQEEVDRLQVKEFANEIMNKEQDFHSTMLYTTSTKGTKKLKQRAQLSDYVLDFGYVNYGSMKTNSCILSNPSLMPVSFTADRQALSSTGFSIEFDKIRDLPQNESIDFAVSFDPKAGNLSLGPVEAVLPVKIINGPNIGLRLKGVVTMPDVQLSSDTIDFESVVCGQCKVVTIQMFNYTQVRCQWSAGIQKEPRGKSRSERIQQRKKAAKVQKDARTFEIMPPSGSLYPGQRVNVQVKFMPTEEELYHKKLLVTTSQSTYRHFLTCRGRGVEPKIEFEKLMVNYGPVLPHAQGDEEEVIVKNPCGFPIEFYCLEFDKKYLEEEKILRAMKGYDEYNTILLPPRLAGIDLPKELIEAFNEMTKKKDDKEAPIASGQAISEIEAIEKAGNEEEAEDQDAADVDKRFDEIASEEEVESDHDAESDFGVGELEITPISAAIARHLGIDLSAEGKAARNRRGIALIVHGAPLSGKTATASSIAAKYNISLLKIDDVVKEAIASGASSAATRVRELSSIAARSAAAAAEPDGAVQHGMSSEVVATASTGHQANPLAGAPSVTGTLHGGFRESRKAALQPVTKQHKAPHASPPATPPLGLPPSKRLSIENASYDGEFYSCILPDDLLVEVVAEKLQSAECQMGVVFDGLESMFTSNIASCANALLRAINNRKFVFVVTLKFSKERLKAIDEEKKADKVKKEEEEKEAEKIRLDEMSEDEYEALPEEEKSEIDRKRLEEKKKKMRRKETEEQKERELREERLAEERRLEEEKVKANRKRVPASQGGNRRGHDKETRDKKHEKSNDRLTVTRETSLAKEKQGEQLTARAGTSGNLSERSESAEDGEKKRLAVSRSGKRERAASASGMMQIEEVVKPTEEEIKEKDVNQRFQAFDSSYRDVVTLFEAWDRTTGSVFLSESEKSELEQDALPMPVTKKGQLMHKKAEKEKEREKSKEIPSSPASAVSGDQPDPSTDDDEIGKGKNQIGVPNIIIQALNPQQSMMDAVLNEQILPSFDEVQDGLGLGPSGPPIPPGAIFSVVPYPKRRKPNAVNEFGANYVFVANSADDPNAAREEKIVKTPEAEVEKAPEKRDHRSRRGRDEISVRASRTDRHPSGARKGRQGILPSSGQAASSPPLVSPSGGDDEKSTTEIGINSAAAELIRHRWVVPALGYIKLKIRFSSPEIGRYDQTLNFELVGTRRRYQLFCRGVCCFPTISKEPRIVFPHRKKSRKPEDIIQKKYILSNKTFEFGPLLAGKNRDRYREGRYPENREDLCISNTSQMDADISFCYQNDTNGSTFLIEPSSMLLKPSESQVLSIWAYPKTPGFFEDMIVGCIKENPEPIVFKISCHGVRPELELDKRIIQFDRVLLYRTETRTVFLRNSTLLPVAWKLSGMDNLGDDFSVPVDNGTIDAKTEFALQMDFKAIKPINVKRMVRLEVSDAANIMGLTHAENIQVQAEAYDVALDMSFPKGADGGLDFGVLRVHDEAKQSLSVKNKGKYEIGFSFVFESTEKCENPGDLFTITPNKGTLIPSDRPTQVQIIFRSKDEVTIKDEPILKCQIIEPSLSDPGEVIAGIPVKVSVRSVYSKYSIFPIQDINFGAILINTRKTKTITIENKGEFDFRYSIAKMQQVNGLGGKFKPAGMAKRSQDDSTSIKSQMAGLQVLQAKQKRADSVRGPDGSGPALVSNAAVGAVGGVSSIRLQLGMFTIFPANGVVLPGASIQVTVDMFSETSVASEEDIAIEVSERPPLDCPGGIEYKIIGETCLPSICTLQQNASSIFEEHRIVSNLNVFRYHSQDLESGSSVYGEEENKFVFYNVIVGHKAQARIRISNPNKVMCDVIFSVKPTSNKPAARWTDIYDVEPQRAAIQPHSFSYVTITFHPVSMQSYSAIFEAAVDGIPTSIAKGRNLVFEIQGEGNLPRVSILRPLSVTNKGHPLLLFNRLLTNRTQTLPLVLKNDGTLPCRVNMTLVDPERCYTVCRGENKINQPCDDQDDAIDLLENLLECTSSKPTMTSIHFNAGEEGHFNVEFTPSEQKRVTAEIRLSVVDNPFEDAAIKLLGEGFEEEVTLDNIHGGMHSVTFADIEDESYAVPRNNHINFGDCTVDAPSYQSFTLTNHSENDVIRFNWDPPPPLTFSPCSGHLLPNCAKDVKVTFQCTEPVKLESVYVPCKITKIQLAKTVAKAGGWDDRMKTVKWVDVKPESFQAKLDDDEKQLRVPSDTNAALRPTKRKLVDTEQEPSFNVISGTASEIELFVSVAADYAKYELSTNKVFFKDTLMFQTRMYSFQLKNTGEVELSYNWSIDPGWTREPTAIDNLQSDEKGARQRHNAVKSAKNSREGSKSPRQQPLTQSKGNIDTRKSSRITPSPGEPAKQTSVLPDARSVSLIAPALDGRPATAMALAYEAGSVFDEPSGNDTLPFSIEPTSGRIKAQEEATFTLRFSPMDTRQYGGTLLAELPNLESGLTPPTLLLYGRSLLPWCHFELEDSNYIASRRNPELKGPGGSPPGFPLDSNTKVIEFQSCGIQAKSTKQFFIVNPTNRTYSFSWRNEDSSDPNIPSSNCQFICLTKDGTIEAGKKAEIVFEYVPESLELQESFWRFHIQEQNVSVSFLLVGVTTDPQISLDKSHLNFKELLVGHKGVQTFTIVNDEDKPFQFSFDKESLYAPGRIACLKVAPMSGTIEAASKCPVTVEFIPETAQEVNFNLVCKVKKKMTPLVVNIKAEGFKVASKLICEDSQGNKVNLLSSGVNLINLGEIEVNEKVVRHLFIENTGKFNIDFQWELIQSQKPKGCKHAWSKDDPPVTISPDSGVVQSNARKRCQLSFCPPCNITLKGCELILKIVNGSKYRLEIVGSGVTPLLNFSFETHDFGPCFIYRPGLPVPKTTLVIENRDSKEVGVECQQKENSFLEVISEPRILAPSEKLETEIFFYPRELKRYHAKIPFEMNGLSKRFIDITGQGTEMKVEVANPLDKKVNLGALRVGQTCERAVKIINNSLAAIEFAVAVTPSSSYLQQGNILTISPLSNIFLRPKEITNIAISFAPKSRIPQFSEEVILECAGISQPLSVVTGSCHGLDIKLDSDAIPFGSVTVGSSSSRKLIMHNIGDIGAAFCWNIEKFKPDFKMSPLKGYIAAGMEVAFDITFTPTVISHDIRYDGLRCAIEGGRPLKLVLTGSCISQVPMKETIHFQAHVRNRDLKQLTIHNRTNQLWLLKPILDGEYWSGPEAISIDPQQGKSYEITYRPLTMTLENKKHTGTVFFALPDGSGLLYTLTGTADPPKPAGNIPLEVPCKMPYTEVLQVTNWLRKPQRFKVSIEMLKPDKPDPATTLKGLDYADVPGLSKKEYKLNFYAHKEGTFSAKVTFKNEQTLEYQFFYVQFKATPPGVISAIDLSTPVRQSNSGMINVSNPLQIPVTFQLSCNVQDVSFPPQRTVPPQSEQQIIFEYLPMKIGEFTARLSLQSPELGLYLYDLNLTATPANPERPVHFVSNLGISQTQTCRFINYARSKVEYACKVDNPEFLVDRSLTAASASSGGSEVGVDVTFEPTKIGDCKSTLTITSTTGGEYVFPLVGHSLAPKPQGPYTVKAGGTTTIPFKNIFPQTTSFVFIVDNPCFSVKSGETSIRGKKTHNVTVGFEGNQGESKAVRMGRLVVSCPRSAGTPNNLTWTFYLKGITP